MLKFKTKNLFITLLVFVIFHIIINTFVLTFSWIPSNSMENTIKANSFVIIDQISYGANMPKRLSEVAFLKNIFFILPDKSLKFDMNQNWGDHRVTGLTSPKKGDVIVFDSPEDYRIILCKRIVAMSGDTVEIRKGNCYINNKLQVYPQSVQQTNDNDTILCTEFPLGSRWNKHNYGPLIIPYDKGNTLYFVMGDNRIDSRDSRAWGLIQLKNIKGRVILSFNHKLFE